MSGPDGLEGFRPYEDNVLIRLEPLPDKSESGLVHVVQREARRRGTRTAVVVAVGPGTRGIPCFSHPQGALLPMLTRPGDRVLVDALAGQGWDPRVDRRVPRHNGTKGELALGPAEYRVVRESGEILAVLEQDGQ